MFTTDREAKEFLVSMIVAESSRTGVSLSKTEEKMLYFSETDWTLPDILKVNDAFEKQYNQVEYEEKLRASFVVFARRLAGQRNLSPGTMLLGCFAAEITISW